MKITYEVEFDITLRDGAKFPEPKFASVLKETVIDSVHSAFVKALCKVDDDLIKTKKTPVDDVAKWNSKVTEVIK